MNSAAVLSSELEVDAELVQQTGCSPSLVFRVLSTRVTLGCVIRQEEDRRYVLTGRLIASRQPRSMEPSLARFRVPLILRASFQRCIIYGMMFGLLSLLLVSEVPAQSQTQGAQAAAADVAAIPSFVNDVQPILTRFNCNSGGCHGKLAGQNGFKLSLRGYAPDADHRSLVGDESGRRMNRVEPEKSLLLLKATGRVIHGGGQLFATDHPAYKTLRDWIARGAPGPKADDPQVVALETTPSLLTLAPEQRQQLTVTATYSDGSQRDVTWLARFHSNDTAFATISAEGELIARRQGEVSAIASFQSLVDTIELTVPFANEVHDEQFAARHNLIDQHVMNKLRTLRIPPSPLCDDATFVRRVMLDMLGTLPTATELRSFLADSQPQKRERLVASLLERPEFVEYWTLLFSDLLQNRKERDHDVRGAKGVRAFQGWIRDQVARNRPWDELVRELLTASGPSDQNPEVGYFVVTVGEKQAAESEVADSVAAAFLGSRIGCAKCHNHPLEKYTQDDYYHFIGFFSQVVLDRKSPTEGATVLLRGSQHIQNLRRQLENEERELAKLQQELNDLAAVPPGSEAASDSATAEQAASEKRGAKQTQIDQQQTRVKQWSEEIQKGLQSPALVRQPRTGQQLAPRGLDRQPLEIPVGSDPRVRLAEWMTSPSNRQFSGAIVNRLWKHFYGVGLVEAVDDLRDTNPPSNQPLFDAMISELVNSGYNLRHIMQLITNSRTYQLAADTTPENANDTRFYSHYYAKRLPAEVLLDAISQATGVPDTFQGYPLGTRAKELPGPQTDSYFLTTFGRSERVTACACERLGDVTLAQLLHLQNSESLLEKFRHPEGNLSRWIAEPTTAEELIETLYLATYSRLPNDAERQTLVAVFEQGDRKEVATDLFWALLNAKEFTFNH